MQYIFPRITYSDLRRWFVKFFFLIRRRYVACRIATTWSRNNLSRIYLLRIKRAVKYPSHSPSLSSSFHHRNVQVLENQSSRPFQKTVCKCLLKIHSRLDNFFRQVFTYYYYCYFLHGVEDPIFGRREMSSFIFRPPRLLYTRSDAGGGDTNSIWPQDDSTTNIFDGLGVVDGRAT